MLSYRHSYHAGNHADVIKHLVEVAIILYLKKKDKPFCYHDSHAGAGLYSLASEQSQKTGEYKDGIGRLMAKAQQGAFLSPALNAYLDLIKELNPDGNLAFYPGSPAIAKMLLRPTDSIQATELHPTDFPLLQAQFLQRGFSRIEQMDAYAGFKAMLPPLHKRGLVLIDPPYELKTEYQDLVKGLQLAYQRFPQATYAIWYPVIERSSIEAVIDAIKNTGIRNQLRIEYCPKADSEGFGMTGSGMLVINPPYTLAADLKTALAEISDLLSYGAASWQVTELVPE
ncbi:23S rRNA (adenine(2030)-N(6))-methyltransferase RlmJ [Rheinheimera sp.]|uniref:23S rRNA (adenine(2030)-N(6))-methyltransferase RlmJ n=1 Tax=Rheinheimera sp. TaxID=1869214 RepID=UPI002FDE8035